MEQPSRISRNDKTWSEQIFRAAMSCWPDRDDPRYRRHAVLDRLRRPNLFLRLPIPWMDDGGRVRVDLALVAAYLPGGPCRGDLLFRPGLTEDTLTATAFLLLLESRLAPQPGGALLCGVARDPGPLSDGESMRLCRGLRDRIEGYAPPLTWTAGAELPERERGYLGLSAPDSFSPGKAAGYALCFFADAALRRAGRGHLSGKTLAVLGRGPAAENAAALARRMGAQAGTGTDADVIFLCDGLNPLDETGARSLIARWPDGVFEGVPLACAPAAAAVLVRAGILFAPAFAVRARPEADPPRSVWEAENRLRRAAAASLRAVCPDDPRDLCRNAAAVALCSAADALLRRGV